MSNAVVHATWPPQLCNQPSLDNQNPPHHHQIYPCSWSPSASNLSQTVTGPGPGQERRHKWRRQLLCNTTKASMQICRHSSNNTSTSASPETSSHRRHAARSATFHCAHFWHLHRKFATSLQLPHAQSYRTGCPLLLPHLHYITGQLPCGPGLQHLLPLLLLPLAHSYKAISLRLPRIQACSTFCPLNAATVQLPCGRHTSRPAAPSAPCCCYSSPTPAATPGPSWQLHSPLAGAPPPAAPVAFPQMEYVWLSAAAPPVLQGRQQWGCAPAVAAWTAVGAGPPLKCACPVPHIWMKVMSAGIGPQVKGAGGKGPPVRLATCPVPQ